MKNRRSLFVNRARPRTLRCSTITWCLSAAFSASSGLFGLKGEATRFKRKNISSTIVADVKRFGHQIKRTRFSAHTGGAGSARRRPGGPRGQGGNHYGAGRLRDRRRSGRGRPRRQ